MNKISRFDNYVEAESGSLISRLFGEISPLLVDFKMLSRNSEENYWD